MMTTLTSREPESSIWSTPADMKRSQAGSLCGKGSVARPTGVPAEARVALEELHGCAPVFAWFDTAYEVIRSTAQTGDPQNDLMPNGVHSTNGCFARSEGYIDNSSFLLPDPHRLEWLPADFTSPTGTIPTCRTP